ncbi:PepSY-associated TM helix domain-containing protein [Curvivirga sp.]|uniref:PepSY-associated TM helix domain-containing protein n=1 Tax=Curvivirga sp. TaxID=2856848 RepID=UPI003B5B14B7
MKIRQKLVVLHRYVGLVMASFLIITSLTGVVLVWYHELDTWIHEQSFPSNLADKSFPPLSDFELRQKVDDKFPDGSVNWMLLHQPSSPDVTLFLIEPKTQPDGTKMKLGFNEIFVDRRDGEILATRQWGDISQGSINLIPFLYRLHESLTLGRVGTYILGVISILWLLDCFTGIVLTFPAKSKSKTSRLKRWGKAWKVRWWGGRHKITFDLHTAGSLWAWICLSIFALSSFAMTLQYEVYFPTMSTMMEFKLPPRLKEVELAQQKTSPEMGWEKGYQTAARYLESLSKEKGFEIIAHERMEYYPHKNTFRLMSRTNLDINDIYGQSWVYVDASTGEERGYFLPTSMATGNTFTLWLNTLHIARIWGIPYRIAVTIIGLFVAMITITGVLIWWRKKKAKQPKFKETKKAS